MNAVTIWQTRLKSWRGCKVTRLLRGGYRNAAALVERTGHTLVAKTSVRTKAQLSWLRTVHEHARAAGFVIPDYVLNDDGEIIHDSVTLETFIAGHHPKTLPIASLTARLQHFHTLCQTLPQRPGFASATELLNQMQGGDVDLTLLPDELVHCCRKAWSHLKHQPTTVIHGDLNPGNVIVTPDNRLALIDWDEARVDSPMFDTIALQSAELRNALDYQAQLAFEIASSWQREPEYARSLIPRLGCETL